MSTDRPDLRTFDGRNVREHAIAADEAIRAINHITSWPHDGMTYPSDASDVVSSLAALARKLPQALSQIGDALHRWNAAGHVGIDRGRPYEGNPGGAIVETSRALAEASNSAAELYTALHDAAELIAGAHWTGPDLYVEIVDDRDNDGAVD
jgi:hypothetical protein